MGSAKRYFWLKLKDTFFNQKEIKKIRKLSGGDTYTIIYLKMQLKSIKTNGILTYDGIEDTFYEELALDLDEKVEDVKMTIAYLVKLKLLIQLKEDEFCLKNVLECIGSESDSSKRMRKLREKQKLLELGASHCDTNVINSDTEIESDIDIEKELDINTENDRLISMTNDMISRINKLKLVQDKTEKYDEIFRLKNIYFKDISCLPQAIGGQVKLFQHTVKRLYDTSQTELLERVNISILQKVFGKVATVSNIEDILEYYISSLTNELTKENYKE